MYVCMSDVCLSVTFFTKTTNFYISTKNKDNATKPSENDPWGPPRSSMVSRMTLSSKSCVRLPIEISTKNFQGIFLGVKKDHS